MTGISSFRLYCLRGIYLLIAVAQGLNTWPGILHHEGPWAFNAGVVACMMGALTALSALGLRYPLQMLPLMFWEIAWKTIWLIVVALPAWQSGQVDTVMRETTFACGLVVLVYAVVPWDYVYANYVIHRGDPWRGTVARHAE